LDEFVEAPPKGNGKPASPWTIWRNQRIDTLSFSLLSLSLSLSYCLPTDTLSQFGLEPLVYKYDPVSLVLYLLDLVALLKLTTD
jgi:hypothetical protein